MSDKPTNYESKIKVPIIPLIPLIASALLLLGCKTFFRACAITDESSIMACHWAEQAVFAFSLVLVVLAALQFVFRDARIKMGLALSMVPVAGGAMLIPGLLIRLCMMPEMRCNRFFLPGVRVTALLIVAAALINYVANWRRARAK